MWDSFGEILVILLNSFLTWTIEDSVELTSKSLLLRKYFSPSFHFMKVISNESAV